MFNLSGKIYSFGGNSNSSELYQLQFKSIETLSKRNSDEFSDSSEENYTEDTNHLNIAMETSSQIQKKVSEITLLLTEQLGFSDGSTVIKKCLDVQQLVSKLEFSLQEQQASTKKLATPKKVSIRTPSSTPVVTVKRQRAQTISDRFDILNTSTPPKPGRPEKPPNFQESSLHDDLTADQQKTRTPFKPASDFGNMNQGHKKRARTIKGKKK